MRNDAGYAKSEDDIDLLELGRVAWAHKRLVFGTTAVVTILAVIYALSVTPVYRAQIVFTEVRSEGRSGGASSLLGEFGGLAGLAGINLDGLTGNSHRNGRVLIESRTFAEEFISRHNLLPVIFADDWNEAAAKWNPDLEQEPTLWQGAIALRQAYQLDLDRETGLLTLTVEWTDAERAAQFANNMVALANQIARERDIASAERSVAYLNDQIADTNVVELRRVLYNLLESEQKTLMLANAREEYVFRVVDPALEPIRRAKPNRRLIAVLGLVTGFGLGLFMVVVLRAVSKARGRA
jgi:uncharacterized protein involved in exopolysaccharide biosynthesis